MGWTVWPPAAEQNRIFIRPGTITLPAAPNPQPAVLEPRVLSTLWPRIVRLGDPGMVRLEFAPDPIGASGQGGAQPADVYETHNVLLEARLEMPGMRVSPPGLSSQALLPGQVIRLQWQVSADEAGEFEGTVWVYLRFVPRTGEAQEQILIAVKPVQVRSVMLLGLVPAGVARAAGWVGIVVGLILGLPIFDEAARRLWMRTGI